MKTKRYEIKKFAAIRNRDRVIGTREPVLERYERVLWKRLDYRNSGKLLAAFICPGHPLLNAVGRLDSRTLS